MSDIDKNRRKTTYPFLRRQRRPVESTVITIVSETIVRQTEFITLGAPGLFINNSTLSILIDRFDDPFQRMIVVTGSSIVAPPA